MPDFGIMQMFKKELYKKITSQKMQKDLWSL